MNSVFIVIAAIAMAVESNGYSYSHPVVRSFENDQYFTQDGYGQYAYGYKAPQSNKQEMRTLDGITRGTYSYIDGAGIWQTVQYIADADGFHVSGTNIPQMPNDPSAAMMMNDSEEVISARALQAPDDDSVSKFVKEKARLLPQPVKDTADVAAAKERFFKRYNEEEQRHKAIREGARRLILL